MLTGLVSSIRDFLADPDGDRWNDARLLYLINQAQIDIVKQTKCLSAIERIDTQVDYTEVDLPTNFLQLDSVLLDGKKLDIVSMDDIVSSSNLYDQGVPSKIIFTNSSKDKIRMYPLGYTEDSILVQSNDPSELYGLSNLFTPGTYGIFEEIPNYFPNPREWISDLFGVIFLLPEFVTFNTYDIEIVYNKLPKLVESFEESLEIGYEYDLAVQHYVCYHLLRADTDAQSRTLGNEELKLYDAEIKKFKKDSGRDFTNSTFSQIEYRRL